MQFDITEIKIMRKKFGLTQSGLSKALKRLGVETELVVYPGEYHGISTPSYIKDLYQRYLKWFGGHLQTQ